MVKITLEQTDIKKLIDSKYPKATIISGLADDMEIVIRVEELTVETPTTPPPPPTNQVLLGDGSIDADASGLTLKNREVTKPGHAMGRSRGRLPTF